MKLHSSFCCCYSLWKGLFMVTNMYSLPLKPYTKFFLFTWPLWWVYFLVYLIAGWDKVTGLCVTKGLKECEQKWYRQLLVTRTWPPLFLSFSLCKYDDVEPVLAKKGDIPGVDRTLNQKEPGSLKGPLWLKLYPCHPRLLWKRLRPFIVLKPLLFLVFNKILSSYPA